MEIISTNSITDLLYVHRYIFAFLGALFEGTFIMILAGVLLKLKYFNFWGLLAVLIGGYVANGFMWYLIGRFGGHKILADWGKRFHFTNNLIERLEEYFKNHSIKTLFVTRITYGFSMLTFMIAGSFKMNPKKFFIVNLIATIIWVLGLVGLGFVFGVSYYALSVVTKSIKLGLTITLFVVIGLISFGLVFWLRRIAEARFMQKLSENNQSRFLRRLGEIISKFAKK